MRHLARSVAACAYGYALPVVVFSLLLTGSPANAHNSADWYYEKWSSATYSGIQMDKHVDWRFVDNVPTSARSRVRDGADDWSSLAASMDFLYPTQQADYSNLDWPNCDPNVNSDTYQKDKIGWSDFGSPGWHTSEALAVTLICDLGTGYLWQFKIAFNADAPWYMGTGNTPSDQDELWAQLLTSLVMLQGERLEVTDRGTSLLGQHYVRLQTTPTSPRTITQCAHSSGLEPRSLAHSKPTTRTPSRTLTSEETEPREGWRAP